MERFFDWEERLERWADQAALRPFVWGEHDCALMVADAAVAMTGKDFGKPFRGKYNTARGAAEALRAYGAGTLQRTLTAVFGNPIHPAFAQRGDAVMASGNAGICMGETALFLTDDGLTMTPRAEWTKAWAIGRG